MHSCAPAAARDSQSAQGDDQYPILFCTRFIYFLYKHIPMLSNRFLIAKEYEPCWWGFSSGFAN
jgi:hypothetical protein